MSRKEDYEAFLVYHTIETFFSGVSRNTAPSAPAQNIDVTAINKV